VAVIAAAPPGAGHVVDVLAALLRAGGEVLLGPAVRLQHRLHRVAQPFEGLAAVGVFAVAAAVAGVNLPLGVEEEHREGQVVVELEEVQIEVVDARQPDADEALGDVFDLLQTDNLPVKLTAGRSGLAAQHD
jgi:hypothetical protein